MPAPSELIELVERFERNIEAYKSGQYNEAQVRREYIAPLFELLGWDVQNRQGYAEAYKDVIHEDSLRIGGTAKAPDYGFRIGGTRKFFLLKRQSCQNRRPAKRRKSCQEYGEISCEGGTIALGWHISG